MKHGRQNGQATTSRPDRAGKGHGTRHGRQEINRFLRRFLIFVLIVLMIAVSFAGYASRYPVSFMLPTPVWACERSAAIDYRVFLKPNDFTGKTELGMDQVYLRDFTDFIQADFRYEFKVPQADAIQYRYQLDAIVRVHDASNPDLILLTREISLLPETVGEISGSNLILTDRIDLDLQEFESLIAGYQSQSSQPATFDLLVVMSVRTVAALPFGHFTSTGSPALRIPLGQSQFTLTRSLPEQLPLIQLLPVTYRLVLSELPFAVYPAMAGACFLLLVLLLSTTRSRRKNRYDRRLRRLLRIARSQLMIIGDKAWEPEWCVNAADFRSMVRTARKLKHPIFCYIDNVSPTRAAYFYIYYGENNYCFTFSDSPAGGRLQLPSDDGFSAGETDAGDLSSIPEPDDRIPLLPDTDDSPEILLANLRSPSSALSNYN